MSTASTLSGVHFPTEPGGGDAVRTLRDATPAHAGALSSGDPFDDFEDDDFDDEFDDDFEETWDDDDGDDGFGPEFQEDPEEDDGDKFQDDPDFDE